MRTHHTQYVGMTIAIGLIVAGFSNALAQQQDQNTFFVDETGARQSAQKLTEQENLYVLEYNLKTYTIRKSIVARTEQYS